MIVPAKASSSPLGFAIMLLGGRLARPDVVVAELHKVFISCKDRVSELEPPLLLTASTDARLYSHATALQTDIVNVRADLTAKCSFATLKTSDSEMTQLSPNGDCSKSLVSDLTSTVDIMRLKIATAHS